MQVNSSPLSLFDFIENKTKSNEVFDNLTKQPQKSVRDDFRSFERGLNEDQYETTLRQIEKGEISLDIDTVKNYFTFNLARLEEQLSSVRENFNLEKGTVIKIDDNKLIVESEQDTQPDERLQKYLDKNTDLQELVSQTSKLSKFVEWAEAKEQAAQFKQQGMDEDKLVAFLKDARRVVTEPDHLLINQHSTALDSQGYTKFVIDKYTEKVQTS